MRLISVDGEDYWVMDDAKGSEKAVQDAAKPLRGDVEETSATKRQELLAEASGADGGELSAGYRVELDGAVRDQLERNGFAAFSGTLVRVDDRLGAARANFMRTFERLRIQSFGEEGSSNFFGGRSIHIDSAELSPGECDVEEDNDGFLACLIKATIRVLPDYDRTKEYPVSWMLSRHENSVDAMSAHHDNVGWLVQYCIHRSPGIRGGDAILLDEQSSVEHRVRLIEELDGYIVRDARYTHSTTALAVPQGGDECRDILVMRLPSQ